MIRYLFIFLLLPSIVYAQSFNCMSDNLSHVEKIICTDTNIKKCDSELAVLYRKSIKDSGKYAYLVKDSQKSWILRRDKCDDSVCVLDEYTKRIRWYSEKLYQDMYKSRFREWTSSELKLLKDLKDNHALDLTSKPIKECTEIYNELTNGKIKPLVRIVDRGSLDDVVFNLDACAKLDISKIYTTSGHLWGRFYSVPLGSTEDNGSEVFLPRTPENLQEVENRRGNLDVLLLNRGINVYRIDYDNNAENGLEILFEMQGRFWRQDFDEEDTRTAMSGSDEQRHFIVSTYENCSEKYNYLDMFMFNGGGVMEVIDPRGAYDKKPYIYFYYKQKLYKLSTYWQGYSLERFTQNKKESIKSIEYNPVSKYNINACEFKTNK